MTDDFAAWAAELPDEIAERVKHDILLDACHRQAQISAHYPDESRMPPEVVRELEEMRRLVDRL